jgi:hypothetical protein
VIARNTDLILALLRMKKIFLVQNEDIKDICLALPCLDCEKGKLRVTCNPALNNVASTPAYRVLDLKRCFILG